VILSFTLSRFPFNFLGYGGLGCFICSFALDSRTKRSPFDGIWGIGLTAEQYLAAGEKRAAWKGKNLLGVALTSVRKALRAACTSLELYVVTSEHMSNVTFRGMFDSEAAAKAAVEHATVTKEVHASEEATAADRVFVVCFGYVPLLVTLNEFRAQSFLADALLDVDRSEQHFYSISTYARNAVASSAE
jgi:hypothetical protein